MRKITTMTENLLQRRFSHYRNLLNRLCSYKNAAEQVLDWSCVQWPV